MNLLEIISAYQDILRTCGRAKAASFMDDVGVKPVIKSAVIASFGDGGEQLQTD